MIRDIALFAYPGANLLDISRPLQVFAAAAAEAVNLGVAESPPYRIGVWSFDGGPVTTTAAVAVESRSLEDHQQGPDTP